MPLIADFPHATGQHCGSTALRNLLAFYGCRLTEAECFGVGAGLGFAFVRSGRLSPTHMFHGRALALEVDLVQALGWQYDEHTTDDNEEAWQILRRLLDAGRPTVVGVDIAYLPYYRTASHFPGHRIVAVGYDDAAGLVTVSDDSFPELQTVPYGALTSARNAPDYPLRCRNQWAECVPQGPPRSLREAAPDAIARVAQMMLLENDFHYGVAGMHDYADALPGFTDIPDGPWALRFAYQQIEKRGTGGSCFRRMYGAFLSSAAEVCPHVRALGLPERMAAIADAWTALAAAFKAASEEERASPIVLRDLGRRTHALADAETGYYRTALDACAD